MSSKNVALSLEMRYIGTMDANKIIAELLEDIRNSPIGPDRTMLHAGMAASTYYRWQRGDFAPSLKKIEQVRAALDEIHRQHKAAAAPSGQ